MALLTVNEYETVSFTTVHGQAVVCAQEPPIVASNAEITAGSVPYGPFNPKTRFVRLNCAEACCLAFGGPDDAAPEAVDGIYRMGPNESLFTGVTPRGNLAVIASSE